ncbi:Heavy metal-associated isoprenylated plant protein [Actinidia chinensis var. chinensis]|uniref:Heavy metal-associated isoprenylated plant protein n=1 Tax=Actinidia chinensis var. chinensis TaxID=1590841 RepID=A0A2R6RNU7_ACTCC|nr:Heavy metal-associated isoprenylated plant protein [Actinidia chinensis var. chinensis]
MGVSGTLEYLSDIMSSAKKGKKRKQLNTVSLKVRMDCEGCQLKVKNALSSLKGVKSVDVDLKQQKVTVTGFVEAKKVLKKAKSTGKKAEPWPYVPYSLIAHPYVAQVYDKKAPPGFVRATDDTAIVTLSTVEEQYTNMFSDENPNACSIM